MLLLPFLFYQPDDCVSNAVIGKIAFLIPVVYQSYLKSRKYVEKVVAHSTVSLSVMPPECTAEREKQRRKK